MARVLQAVTVLAVTAAAGPSGVGRAAELRYTGAMISPVVVADSTRHARHGDVLSAGGGRLLAPGGAFLRFPAGPCHAPPCPQAIVVPRAPGRLGGPGPFAFGAAVRLTAEPSRAAGMNVWQYGLAGPGHAQWKLQVDGGVPTCRWSDGAGVVLVRPGTLRLRVGRWYVLRCARVSPVLFELRVLDRGTGAPVVAPAYEVGKLGAIQPQGMPTIGGKRVDSGQDDRQTDQFHGDLDDVYFAYK
ncbi:hypothetical protein [Nonomuraea sp. SBT364]|uniref:hypothetical protein n=1 Tax=Nonomuraea sp. SBT364 TaxID=1580530 RepID=UPI0012E20A94|nr:hypothetical protein [Nonomuraea sp. SBT364]